MDYASGGGYIRCGDDCMGVFVSKSIDDISGRLEKVEILLGLRKKPKTQKEIANELYDKVLAHAKAYAGCHPMTQQGLDYFTNYGSHREHIIMSLGCDMATLVEMYHKIANGDLS